VIGAEKSLHEAEKLRRRSKEFAFDVIRLVRRLPATDEGRIIGRQLLRSGTSVAANYRAVSRSRSRPEFISRMGIVIEEADESSFWLEALLEMQIVRADSAERLLKECQELIAIFVASQRTARKRGGSSSPPS
jgi:four helix bundle protein